MKQNMLFEFAVLLMCLVACPAGLAGELVWTPVNPSFGGNAINGAWMLSQANAQNKFLDKSSSSSSSALDDFQSRLESQVLFRLASDILDVAYGNDTGLLETETEEVVEVGTYTVTITELNDKIKVNMIDTSTGGSTTVEIPFF